MMELLLFVAAAVRISVPYTLAAVGASFSASQDTKVGCSAAPSRPTARGC